MRADWLFLLTDVPALYTADPSRDPKATRIGLVRSIAELKVQIGSVGDWGTVRIIQPRHKCWINDPR